MPNHVYISEFHPNIIGVGPNFPATPFKFQRWWISDSVANTLSLYYHNGTSWAGISGSTSLVLENLASDPATPASGRAYLNTSTNKVRSYINSAWQNFITDQTAFVGDVTGTHGATVVGKVNGTAVSGTPALNKYLAGSSGSAAVWGELTLASYSVDPGGTPTGLIYLNSVGSKLRCYISGAWQDLISSTTTVGGDVSGTHGNIVLPTKGTPGTYAYPSQIITDSKGAVTSVTAGTSPSATAVGGDVSGSVGNIILPAKGTAGTYAYPSQIITDSKGAVTGLTAGSAPVDSNVFTAINNSGSTIAANKAVASDGTTLGIKLADAGATNDFAFIGFTTASIANGASGTVQVSGVLSGFTGLATQNRYWVDTTTPGNITNGVPSLTNGKAAAVGVALSATTLTIQTPPRIKLNATATQTNFLALSSGVIIDTPVAVTPANNLGAVALQATTPGTQQTGNINISNKLITGGDVAATGNVSGVNVTGSGTVQGATVTSTGAVNAATAFNRAGVAMNNVIVLDKVCRILDDSTSRANGYSNSALQVSGVTDVATGWMTLPSTLKAIWYSIIVITAAATVINLVIENPDFVIGASTIHGTTALVGVYSISGAGVVSLGVTASGQMRYVYTGTANMTRIVIDVWAYAL